MKLQIEPVGNPEFPRFIISRSDEQVFDGAGWNPDRGRAAMYSEGQHVALAFNALQEEMYRKWPIQEFVVPLNIRVRSAHPFSKEALEEYLERAVSIFLDQEKGDGPVENSVVQLDVTWREMRQRHAAKDKKP